jgi:hypothetical protein
MSIYKNCNRIIERMEQIYYNLTIIKAFREEIISSNDVYNGKPNEKHYIPSKYYFVLNLNQQLAYTHTCKAHTIVCVVFLKEVAVNFFTNVSAQD